MKDEQISLIEKALPFLLEKGFKIAVLRDGKLEMEEGEKAPTKKQIESACIQALKEEALVEVANYAEKVRHSFLSLSSALEAVSLQQQVSVAERVVAQENPAKEDLAILELEAKAQGKTPEEFAQWLVTQERQLEQINGQLRGLLAKIKGEVIGLKGALSAVQTGLKSLLNGTKEQAESLLSQIKEAAK